MKNLRVSESEGRGGERNGKGRVTFKERIEEVKVFDRYDSVAEGYLGEEETSVPSIL